MEMDGLQTINEKISQDRAESAASYKLIFLWG